MNTAPTTDVRPARNPFVPIAVPAFWGVGAAILLLAIYIVIVGLAQGWVSAVQLLGQDAYLVAPITASFGVQVGLYTYLRRMIRRRTSGAGAMTGASGGTSAAAMVACCAHRVADLLPILGLSAVAGFLAAWKVPFMIVGLSFSLAGIAVILRRIVAYKRKHLIMEVERQ